MLRPIICGIMAGALLAAGCGPAVRYDVQAKLDLRGRSDATRRAERDGWLLLIFSRSQGPWIETNHAFAVGKGDSLALRCEGNDVVVSVGGQELRLDEFQMTKDVVALAFREERAVLSGLALAGLTTIQVVALAVAVVGAGAILLAVALADDDEDDSWRNR